MADGRACTGPACACPSPDDPRGAAVPDGPPPGRAPGGSSCVFTGPPGTGAGTSGATPDPAPGSVADGPDGDAGAADAGAAGLTASGRRLLAGGSRLVP
ncbi:hypothetical protein [Actinomadura sp. RB99]|uniref:hypothetical protein n=1 Tax=Actinomadura sp. RB99 TaxID=2691577 RepID=UPI001684B2D9|nr:hypothetical protein [Actinomadura sp. RB99]